MLEDIFVNDKAIVCPKSNEIFSDAVILHDTTTVDKHYASTHNMQYLMPNFAVTTIANEFRTTILEKCRERLQTATECAHVEKLLLRMTQLMPKRPLEPVTTHDKNNYPILKNFFDSFKERMVADMQLALPQFSEKKEVQIIILRELVNLTGVASYRAQLIQLYAELKKTADLDALIASTMTAHGSHSDNKHIGGSMASSHDMIANQLAIEKLIALVEDMKVEQVRMQMQMDEMKNVCKSVANMVFLCKCFSEDTYYSWHIQNKIKEVASDSYLNAMCGAILDKQQMIQLKTSLNKSSYETARNQAVDKMSKTVHEEKQLGAMINESESMVIYGLKKYLKDFVDHWVELQ